MPASTVTSKGQITIPKAVRTQLRLEEGDRVEFVTNEDGQVVLLPSKTDLRLLRGLAGSKGKKRRSIAEMDAAVRKRLAEKHRGTKR